MVPARWVPVKVNVMVLDNPCRVLPAALGNVNVASRSSVLPAVSVDRLLNARLDPITGRNANTVLVDPPQVYVYAGATPASVHPVEHAWITNCSPLLVSVSSKLDGEAVVVNDTDAKFWFPVFDS